MRPWGSIISPAAIPVLAAVGGSTFDVNTFLGRGRTTPIIGQNTVTTNLEAGYFWNGHETPKHVVTNTTNFISGSTAWGGTSVAPKYDRHATWATMLIGGRQTVGGACIRTGSPSAPTCGPPRSPRTGSRRPMR